MVPGGRTGAALGDDHCTQAALRRQRDHSPQTSCITGTHAALPAMWQHRPAALGPAITHPSQPTCCRVSCCSASSSGTPVALNHEVTAAPAMVVLADAALLACTCTVPRCRAGCCRGAGCAARGELRRSWTYCTATWRGPPAAAAAAPGRRRPAPKALTALPQHTPAMIAALCVRRKLPAGRRKRGRRVWRRTTQRLQAAGLQLLSDSCKYLEISAA